MRLRCGPLRLRCGPFCLECLRATSFLLRFAGFSLTGRRFQFFIMDCNGKNVILVLRANKKSGFPLFFIFQFSNFTVIFSCEKDLFPHRRVDRVVHGILDAILVRVVDAAPLTAAAIRVDPPHVIVFVGHVIRALVGPRKDRTVVVRVRVLFLLVVLFLILVVQENFLDIFHALAHSGFLLGTLARIVA